MRKVHIIGLGQDLKMADELYEKLEAKGVGALYDDRDARAGEKFAEADLIGIPYRVVVSEKTIAKNCAEVKERDKSTVKLVKIKQLAKNLKFQINS